MKNRQMFPVFVIYSHPTFGNFDLRSMLKLNFIPFIFFFSKLSKKKNVFTEKSKNIFYLSLTLRIGLYTLPLDKERKANFGEGFSIIKAYCCFLSVIRTTLSFST